MNKQKIFETAVERAIERGWDIFGLSKGVIRWEITKVGNGYDLLVLTKNSVYSSSFPAVIFNHKFAKALCGNEMMTIDEGLSIESWMYFLQTMATAKDRYLYLSRWLEMPY